MIRIIIAKGRGKARKIRTTFYADSLSEAQTVASRLIAGYSDYDVLYWTTLSDKQLANLEKF